MFLMGLMVIIVANYFTELKSKENRPPVAGPIFFQLLNFSNLFDYLTSLARPNPTYRMITPTHSEIYTADPVVVEYILKTNFPNYGKVGNHHFISLCVCVFYCLVIIIIIIL